MKYNIDYDAAIKFAKSVIKRFKLNTVEPGDLVNDAFITLVDSGNEVTQPLLQKEVNNLAYQKNYNKNQYDKLLFNNQNNVPSIIFCKCCQQDLPGDVFGVTVRKKTGTHLIQTYCKYCQAKKMRAHYKKKNPIPKRGPKRNIIETIKEGNKRRFKEYFEKNKDKWNAYIRSRYIKKKAAKKAALIL